ncbi:MAG: GNAT family N-acetyltransferase [Phaeodactylibacter sp.]|nr:GNAT family N-acetyltransferase [Phaeodactylibacter sp.]MCB9049159.1 GNAT family N-acetyltransferase [Lewinellaceae bacterium]
MKLPSADYSERCSLYQSIQSIFSPSFSGDGSIPPNASSSAAYHQPLSVSGFELAVFHMADSLPDVWDELLPEGQQMMGRAYLRAQEQAPAEGMGYAYLMFYKNKQAIGLAACQLMEFRALQQIQSLQQMPEGNLVDRLWHAIKRAVASRINYKLIICGATQFTGQHAFVFDPAQTNSGLAMGLLDEGLQLLAGSLREEGWYAGGILIKDLEKGQPPFLRSLEAQGYSAFPFQPNMILPVRPEWNSFEDYLEAMVSKYRVRARRAFKKGKGLLVKEMDEEALSHHQEEIYSLYNEIAGRADFNMLALPKDYFLSLKRAMPGEFRVFGYYLQEQLVGFCSTLNNGPELEAHFIGFRPEVNHEYQLYLNMLYDMIRIGMDEGQVERIVFSRTAMEIKSSVGAEPVKMYCCLRHLNPTLNRVLPALVRWLEPKEENWVQRHPFGDSGPNPE